MYKLARPKKNAADTFSRVDNRYKLNVLHAAFICNASSATVRAIIERFPGDATLATRSGTFALHYAIKWLCENTQADGTSYPMALLHYFRARRMGSMSLDACSIQLRDISPAIVPEEPPEQLTLSDSHLVMLDIIKILVQLYPEAVHARSKERAFHSSLPIQYAIERRAPAALVAFLALQSTEDSWMFLVQQENVSSYMTLTLDQAVASGGVAAVRKLAEARDKDGRIALDIASSANRELIEGIILHLGRYRLDHQVYTSASSTVHLASDHFRDRRKARGMERNSGRLTHRLTSFKGSFISQGGFQTNSFAPERVILKVMRDAAAFTRERKFRSQLDGAFVVAAVRWHAEDCTLAMIKAERSLEDFISGGCFAGETHATIHALALQVARGVEHVHKHRVIHADLKPRNVLYSDGAWKLCDFDSAVYFNGYFDKSSKVSTAYCAPELAALFLGPEESHEVLSANLMAARRAVEGDGVSLLPPTPRAGRFKWAAITADMIRGKHVQQLQEDLALKERLMALKEAQTEGGQLPASPSVDVWSFGLILFQLVTGTKLFRMDDRDNINDGDVRELLFWPGLPGTNVEQLELVFNGAANHGRPCALSVQASTVSLLRACLHPSAGGRPATMSDAIRHSFLSPENAPRGKVLICSAPERGLDTATGNFDFPVMEAIQAMCSELGGLYTVA